MDNTSLQSGLDVLLLFDTSRRQLTVSDIAQSLGYTQSKAYRLVKTLTESNFLQKAGKKQYALGLNVYRLGLVAQQDYGLPDIAKPFMEELSHISRESVYLSIRYGTRGMLIEKVQSPEPIQYSHYKVGQMSPLTIGASGTVLLAHCPKDEWDRVIGLEGLTRYTPFTVTDPDRFKNKLEQIVLKGYSFSDQEQVEGVRAIAVPIKNSAGDVVAALAIIGPAYRMPKKRIHEFARAATDFAAKISHGIK